ncbi:MAG: hypothetical protein OXC91_12255 [Rhodobacteraceae bacterium]|nr:hypothetical protein [Paracoccaceae bacterium]
MEASMLEETVQNPNPYPVVAELHYDDIWHLCKQSQELAWDPVRDIDWAALKEETSNLPDEVRQAGAEWWSLRAWMEHGATPYGAERLRQAIFEHLPFEVKQHVTNFILEELRHHQASFLIADALGEYQPTPRSDYFQMVIPKFHDEKDEKVMPFYAGMAVNTLFEQLSGELLTARYKNARYPQIRLACELILRDEARHIQFGRIIMRRFFDEISMDQKKLLGEKFAKKLRGSLLNGVYAVVNLPKDERQRSGSARALAAEYGLGATHPDEEVGIIAEALATIRQDVAPYDVPIPFIKEIEGENVTAALAAE